MHTNTCKIDSRWEHVFWLRELNLGLCDYLEGWNGMGGGREAHEGGTYVYLWLIHVDVWQKPTPYCKYPSIKKLRKKKRSSASVGELWGLVDFDMRIIAYGNT